MVQFEENTNSDCIYQGVSVKCITCNEKHLCSLYKAYCIEKEGLNIDEESFYSDNDKTTKIK